MVIGSETLMTLEWSKNINSICLKLQNWTKEKLFQDNGETVSCNKLISSQQFKITQTTPNIKPIAKNLEIGLAPPTSRILSPKCKKPLKRGFVTFVKINYAASLSSASAFP